MSQSDELWMVKMNQNYFLEEEKKHYKLEYKSKKKITFN